MINVILYTRKDCSLCKRIEKDLKTLQKEIPHNLALIDIDSDPAIKNTYAMEIPVVEVGPYILKAPITIMQLRITLQAASDRRGQLEKINDKAYQVNASGAGEIYKGDRFSYWLSRHYLAIINFFLVLYVGIPFLAPVFKKIHWDGAAQVVYKMYSPLCHQWAFRSFFLFGEQAYYPHAAANIPGVLTFEQVSGITDQNDPGRTQARAFEGNSQLGYKIALCERDIAIWGSLALFGLLYASTGRRFPKIHWLIWIIIGVGPIGLDGFSQLISQLPYPFIHSLLPYRESIPLFRVLTGVLFGFMTGWFMFPLIEETMADTRKILSKKFAIAGSVGKENKK